jgi:alpha 1,3-glucosidase
LIGVSQKLKDASIPCDTLWLDIEYSDGKRYFSWDQKKFANPRNMLDKIVSDQRRLVTIIDPHVKYDEEFFLYK